MLYRLLLLSPLALVIACGDPDPCEQVDASAALPAGCTLDVRGPGNVALRSEAGLTYRVEIAVPTPTLILATIETSLGEHSALIDGETTLRWSWTAVVDEVAQVKLKTLTGEPLPALTVTLVEVGASTDDHSARLAEATPIAVGAPTAGALEVAGDLDLFRFAAKSGVVYQLSASGGASPAVFDLRGEPRTARDDAPARVWVSARDEELLAAVTGPEDAAYELTVTAPPMRHGDSSDDAVVLAPGEEAAGVVALGDEHWFAIDLTAGGPVSVRVLSEGRTTARISGAHVLAVAERGPGIATQELRLINTSASSSRAFIALYPESSAASWQAYVVERVD